MGADRALRPRLLLLLAIARPRAAVRRVLDARAGGARARRAGLPRRQRCRRHGAHRHRPGGRRGDAVARRRTHVPHRQAAPAARRARAARAAARLQARTPGHGERSLPLRPRLARMTAEELLAQADAAAANAYAPYSDYQVGAAVLTRDGSVIAAANVENAAYPLRVCAERAAIAKAASEGLRPGEMEAIAITASPCGGGRQWLHEWGVERVHFRRPDGTAATVTAARPPRTPPTSCCRRRGTCPRHEERFRVGSGPPQRRQVDARERALRRQGRDRLRQAADDPAAHLRD